MTDDVFSKMAALVQKNINDRFEAVILDFVYTMDRWPTERIDFVPPLHDPDQYPTPFPAEHDCLKWHRIVTTFPQVGAKYVYYFRLA